jgi:type IV pilus assembly protein PilB
VTLSLRFMRKHFIVPFSKSEEGVVVIFADPLNKESMEVAKQIYGPLILPALSTKTYITEALQTLGSTSGKPHAGEIQSNETHDIIKIVDELIQSAIDDNVSDIHLEPQPNKIRVRYRKDGVLIHKTDFPKSLQDSILIRIKLMADTDIAEKRRHQDGQIHFKYFNNEVDIRMSSYVTIYGENIVLRILSQSSGVQHLSELGIARRTLRRYITEVLEPSSGVVIMTGPTGSGKTTTLYSSIEHCNDPSIKIITAEDPVESQIPGITQCSINDKIGLTFDETLRSIVRQDPDIIVLGEIRDKESAQVAITAALTGHKVFSTFHTEDSIGGIIRLLDMGIETFLISSTVLSILAQRLLRRICPHCKEAYKPDPLELSQVGVSMDEIRHYEFFHGIGCEHCHYTGYSGRIGVYEMLVLNENVRNAILAKKTSHEIREISMRETEMVTLLEDGISKVITGITTFSELRRHLPYTAKPRSVENILAMTE